MTIRMWGWASILDGQARTRVRFGKACIVPMNHSNFMKYDDDEQSQASSLMSLKLRFS